MSEEARIRQHLTANDGCQKATFNSVNSTINAGHDISLYNVAGDLTINKPVTEGKSILSRLKSVLNPVATACYDSYEANRRSECFPNTRVQVLNDIETWLTAGGQQAPIYVLDGVAGIGKSTVAQTIAVRAAKLGLLGASFFFSRDEDLRKVAKHFFPTIAYHLACYENQFAIQINQSLDKNPDAPEKRLHQQLSLLWLNPLRDVLSGRTKSTLVVVDALDECENESAEELLSLLGQHAHELSGLKILITTRPEWHLRHVLDQDQNHERFRLHDIKTSIVQSDIRLYLHACLSADEIRKAFPHRRTLWQPSARDMEVLCGICGTLFIIAATASKFILDPQSNPQAQLSQILKGVSQDNFTGSKHNNVLDETYLLIILATQSDLDNINEDWFRDFNKVAGALIVLVNPLPCEALASLLDMDPDDLEGVLSKLHSLVAPSEDSSFRIHHKSFPDFITDMVRIRRVLKKRKLVTEPNIDNLLWIDVQNHHLQLAKACFAVMRGKLKWNIADIGRKDDWYKDKEDIPHVVPKLISRELMYATLHWASHLFSSQKLDVDMELQGHLDTWASSLMFFWLEVITILNQVNAVCIILQDALDSMKNIRRTAWDQREKVEELLTDTLRLVQQGSEIMKLSPIHLYRSCLPFAPTGTALYQVYHTRAMLQIGAGRDYQWEPLLVTFIGHVSAVNSVALSVNGSQLCSASSDATIQLWDPDAGAHLSTLTGHSSGVRCIALSGDGSLLASGSQDKTIRLWNARTGAHILTLQGHSDLVRSVAFSGDDSRLVSGSSDKTIMIWDAKTGAHLFKLTGHSKRINSVTFSKNGDQVASGSSDKTIRLWNAKTGVLLSTLTCHSGPVNSVTFSHDGTKFASGSDDMTVQLLDAKTGGGISTLSGHSNRVSSVAFSTDGCLLASGSYDTTIRLWDAKTGTHISTLTGHSGWIHSVVFSNDGSQLASGSDDNTIRLWDAKTTFRLSGLRHSTHISQAAPTKDVSGLVSGSKDDSINTQSIITPIRHSRWVTSVALSEDGTQLASGSYDKTVRIWDGKTGAHIFTLTGHSRAVNSVVFSKDGSQLASGSGDRTICLWNPKTGEHNITLSGHSDWVHSVAFSSDGSQLASGSDDKTIRLWDVRTGTHISTFTGHSGWIRSVVFSNDGLQLASGSDDKTIRVWDSKTGSQISILTGHDHSVSSVAFSNDGSAVVSSSYDKTTRLWDARTGTLKSTLAGPDCLDSEFISVMFLTGGSSNSQPAFQAVESTPQLLAIPETENPTSLLLLVKRASPLVTGLVKATLHSGNKWKISPLCWFPPNREVLSYALNRSHSRLALGCKNGHILLIDFSSEFALSS